jgi:hypothetical protein
MQFTKVVIQAFSLLLSIPASAGLCTTSELDYFSCTTGSAEIALCGSVDVGPNQGYIQFRLSPREGAKVFFPEARRPPAGLFVKDFQLWSKGGYESTLTFQAGTLTYVLYANWLVGSTEAMNEDKDGLYGYHSGLRVSRGDEEFQDLECVPPGEVWTDPRHLDRVLPAFLKPADAPNR